MQEIIAKIIADIQSYKEAGGISPAHALKKEIDTRVMELTNQVLNQLNAENRIQVGDTLNDKWIKTN